MQNRECREYKFINFGCRRVTVIKGQPYYESTGNNFPAKGVWLPFICLKGTNFSDMTNIPDELYPNTLKLYDGEEQGHIIKLNATNFKRPDPDLEDICEGRFPTVEILMTSKGLSGDNFPEEAEAKLKSKGLEAKVLPIKLAIQAGFTSNNPDQVNRWLVDQGATAVKCLFISRITIQGKLRISEQKPEAFKDMLEDYKCLQEKRSGLLKFLSTFNKREKNEVAQKVIDLLDHKSVIFYPVDLNALNDGLLKNIIQKFQYVPQIQHLMTILNEKKSVDHYGVKISHIRYEVQKRPSI